MYQLHYVAGFWASGMGSSNSFRGKVSYSSLSLNRPVFKWQKTNTDEHPYMQE